MRLKYLAALALAVSGTAFAAGKDMLGPFLLMSNGSFTTASTSAVVNVRGFDNLGVQFNEGVSNASTAGTFYVDASADYNPVTGNQGNWASFPLSPVPTVTGPAALVFYQDIHQTAAPYVRVRYVPTASGVGAGLYSVYFGAKAE